ncbi:MAG TPA: hypothetical protein VGL02_30150 [Streptomyces sp.]
MSASQFDTPTTLGQADDNIRQIKDIQASLRRRGLRAEARECDQDIAAQRAAREQIRRNIQR